MTEIVVFLDSPSEESPRTIEPFESSDEARCWTRTVRVRGSTRHALRRIGARNETKRFAIDRSHINHLSQFRGRKDRLRSKSFRWGSVRVAQRVNIGPFCETGSAVPRRGIHLERITGLVDLTDQFDANHSFAIYTPGYRALGSLYSM